MATQKTLRVKKEWNDRGNLVRTIDSDYYTTTIETNKQEIVSIKSKALKKYYPVVFYNYNEFGLIVPEVRFPVLKKRHVKEIHEKWLHVCHECEIEIRNITNYINETLIKGE